MIQNPAIQGGAETTTVSYTKSFVSAHFWITDADGVTHEDQSQNFSLKVQKGALIFGTCGAGSHEDAMRDVKGAVEVFSQDGIPEAVFLMKAI